MVRTNDLAENYAQALKAQGIAVHPISRNRSDNPDIEGVRIATMHRVKGLEFKAVFIAGLQQDNFPLPAPQEDPLQNKAHLAKEMALFYVAASRAGNLLFISASEQFSKLLTDCKFPFLAGKD